MFQALLLCFKLCSRVSSFKLHYYDDDDDDHDDMKFVKLHVSGLRRALRVHKIMMLFCMLIAGYWPMSNVVSF